MLVSLKRQEFESLDDDALRFVLMEPTVRQVRGRSPEVKARVYEQLTPSQRALFMFQVMFEHSRNSAEEFYKWLSYLMLEQETWAGVKRGLALFGDEAMLEFLEETEPFFAEANASGASSDADFLAEIEQRNTRYHEIASNSIRRIAEHIRNFPNEFVQLED